MMNEFSFLFIAFLTLSLIVRLWLSQRHLAHIGLNRGTVPSAFSNHISLQEHQKAADYTCSGVRFGRWDMFAESGILLAWTLGGGLELLNTAWENLGMPELITGVAVSLSMVIISAALDLPFSIYRTFVIEEKFGFNRTKPGLFIGDQLKLLLLLILIGGPLVAAVLWTLLNAGTYWWLYAWLVWLGFNLTIMWVYPVLIAPIFNKFTPLTDDAIRQRIEKLLSRNQLASGGIFVMDGSRRSGHGNAYFTGFGNNKRIVFFDTLLEKLSAEEVEAVLAHEIGHFKHRHILKRVLMTAAITLGGLALLGYLMQQQWFFTGLGVTGQNGYIALLLFILVTPVFTFFLQPVIARLSRQHEFQADDFAAEQADAHTLVQALVKLYSENANTLTPDPLYSAFHDSHPPAPVRVAHL
ncbi:MAG: M48 family metallopeptidase, partial [Gammaproteobacteria bacterium]|nr:M48 family metallopeptidase [Gammaproteobacteria bacterium]